jgi:hypothetical protein
MSILYEGRQCRVGIAPEAVFGTAIADAAAFSELRAEAPELDLDVKVYDIPGASGSKDKMHDMTISTSTGSMPSMTIKSPFSVLTADLVFACAFQSVTEIASTPFGKVFIPCVAHPNFASCTLGTNAYACTLIDRYPEASTSHKLTSAIVESFKISAKRGEMMQLESTWRSLFPASITANPSGTWTPWAAANNYGIKFFNDITTAQAKVTTGGYATLTLQDFSLTFEQEVSGEEIVAGAYTNYGMVNRSLKGDFTVLKNATYEAQMAAFAAGNYITFNLICGSSPATTDGELEIVASGKITAMKSNRSGIITGQITFEGSKAAAADNMITISMCNTVDRNWPAPA